MVRDTQSDRAFFVFDPIWRKEGISANAPDADRFEVEDHRGNRENPFSRAGEGGELSTKFRRDLSCISWQVRLLNWPVPHIRKKHALRSLFCLNRFCGTVTRLKQRNLKTFGTSNTYNASINFNSLILSLRSCPHTSEPSKPSRAGGIDSNWAQ